MTYEAWRISFQSSEQAARAAYSLLASRDAEIAELVAALELIAGTDPVEAAIDPQRAVRVARNALAKVRKPSQEPVKYGCHCDLEDHMQPDGCVLDDDTPDQCVYAGMLLRDGKGRNDCAYWKPILLRKP